jgi:hypothetical protein
LGAPFAQRSSGAVCHRRSIAERELATLSPQLAAWRDNGVWSMAPRQT